VILGEGRQYLILLKPKEGERLSIPAMLKVVMAIIEKTTNVARKTNAIQKKSIYMMPD
jgi:hypothetical protein